MTEGGWELWEEIKLLDVLEVARGKGMEEGKILAAVEISQGYILIAISEKIRFLASQDSRSGQNNPESRHTPRFAFPSVPAR